MVAARTIFQNDDTTVYVDQAGDDSNSGLNILEPKKTIQAMMDTLFREYDHGGTALNVQLADCPVVGGIIVPYAGMETRGAMVGHYGRIGVGGEHASFTLTGNVTDPSKVMIDGGASPAVSTIVGKSLHVDGVTLKSTNFGIRSSFAGTEMVVHRCYFDTCGGTAIYADANAMILLWDGIKIIGDCQHFMYADENALITANSGIDFQIVGQRTFSDFFVGAARNSVVNIGPSPTFSFAPGATATGTRWAVARGGQIDTGGRDPNTLFPGNSNGVVRIGGGFCG